MKLQFFAAALIVAAALIARSATPGTSQQGTVAAVSGTQVDLVFPTKDLIFTVDDLAGKTKDLEVKETRRTVAGDKGYDNAEFVASCRALNVTPHVAQNERRQGGSALDLRTTSWPGYAVSQRVRKRVEEIFGWIKTVGNFRRTRYRGVERTSFAAYLVGAACNLLRIAKLCPSG